MSKGCYRHWRVGLAVSQVLYLFYDTEDPGTMVKNYILNPNEVLILHWEACPSTPAIK